MIYVKFYSALILVVSLLSFKTLELKYVISILKMFFLSVY